MAKEQVTTRIEKDVYQKIEDEVKLTGKNKTDIINARLRSGYNMKEGEQDEFAKNTRDKITLLCRVYGYGEKELINCLIKNKYEKDLDVICRLVGVNNVIK
jgi:hypothetical protein